MKKIIVSSFQVNIRDETYKYYSLVENQLSHNRMFNFSVNSRGPSKGEAHVYLVVVFRPVSKKCFNKRTPKSMANPVQTFLTSVIEDVVNKQRHITYDDVIKATLITINRFEFFPHYFQRRFAIE